MTQTIEAPSTNDTLKLAAQILHGQKLLNEHLGAKSVLGEISDLDLIQKLLDHDFVAAGDTDDLQSLGVLFGCVLVNQTSGLDWWTIEEGGDRTPAIRYECTSLLVFPQTMLSKRMGDHETIDVRSLYEAVRGHVEERAGESESV